MLILIALGVASIFVALPFMLGQLGLVIDLFILFISVALVLFGQSDFSMQQAIDRTRRGGK